MFMDFIIPFISFIKVFILAMSVFYVIKVLYCVAKVFVFEEGKVEFGKYGLLYFLFALSYITALIFY